MIQRHTLVFRPTRQQPEKVERGKRETTNVFIANLVFAVYEGYSPYDDNGNEILNA